MDEPTFLASPGGGTPGEWSRRYKANVARLNSGDRDQIAEVVRQLSERQDTKGLSQGEKRMLDRAVELFGGTGGSDQR